MISGLAVFQAVNIEIAAHKTRSMISNCLRTAIISALILMGQSAAAAQSVPARITIQDMLSDLDTLHSIIEQSHPDLYRATDKAAIESRWVAARKSLKMPLTTIEFLNFVAPLINQYRDGHTGMDLAFETEEFKTYVKNGGRFFPFGIMIVGDKIYITQSLGETKLAPGTEITAIGGRSSAKVLGELRPLAMGDTPAGRDSTLSRLFAHYLWQVYGGVGSFELRMRPPRRAATSEAKVAAEGVDLDTLSKAMFGDETVRAYELTPEIFVMKKAMLGWIDSGHRIDLFLAMHNQEAGDYIDGPFRPEDDHARRLAQRFFEALEKTDSFQAARGPRNSLSQGPIARGRMTVNQTLAHERRIPAFLMELGVERNVKLGRLRTTEDNQRFGPTLVRTLAGVVSE